MKTTTDQLRPGDVLTLGVMGRETVLTIRPEGRYLRRVTVRRWHDNQTVTFRCAPEAHHETTGGR